MRPVDDLLQALEAPGGVAHIRRLDASGDLARLVPGLDEGRGFEQPQLHFYDVLQHNIAAVGTFDEAVYGSGAEELRAALAWLDVDAALDAEVGGLPLVPLVRLACLVHDVAKPRTATIVEGRLRFPRHGPTGADLVRETFPILGLPDEAVDLIARLVRQHLRPGELIRDRPPTDRAIRKFTADVAGHVLPLMLVNLADGWATRGPGYTRENFRRHCGFVNYVVALCSDNE